ncbi:MAG TPA: hypothetical protein VMO26_06430 [Vicinamibacterales bacterium]|nr:hypothetical protein [Vicinamibacterales bacterium]
MSWNKTPSLYQLPRPVRIGQQFGMARVGVTGLLLSVTVLSGAQAQPEATLAFLRAHFQFSANDLRDLAQGRATVRSLDTTDGREIAIAGAVRVPIPPAEYIRQLRDIVGFKRHEAVKQIGTFSTPPRPSDAGGLTLDRDHLEDLRRCRPDDCDVQLSRAAIERLNSEIVWSIPGATAEANRVVREILADQVTRYLQAGDTALMTYENDRHPIVVADEFRAMVDAPPALLRHFPALERHVALFPRSRAPHAEDIVYWSKEDVGPKVIISVTHMVIAPVSDGGPVLYAAASKQLYGSHYFDSSLGLTLLLRDSDPGSTVLVYVNRSRIDALSGFLGGLKRAIVRSRARSAMADTLTRIRTRLPERAQTHQGSKVPGFQGSKVPRFQGSKVPRFQGSKVPKF